ncbi:MAG: DHH family phosphoesterase [Chloroflexi bacterium]|nr:DHH family phosphoesterase [Chloroflexota bacterium]
MTKAQKGVLKALKILRRLVILTHDNPDPDAIGAGLALARLAQEVGSEAVFAYGGIIGRAENTAMINLLEIDLVPVSCVDLTTFDGIALVDTQPGSTNHSLRAGLTPTIVIDHHPRDEATAAVPYADVRPDYGASSTILYEYLRAARVVPDRPLATALFYGLKVDTQNLSRGHSAADERAFMRLFPLVDHQQLSRIEYPPLPYEYFETLRQGLERAYVHGDVVISQMDDIETPHPVAEIADLLLRLEGVRWSACFACSGEALYLSLRTNDLNANAGVVVRRVVRHHGSSGGHPALAAGRVPLKARTRSARSRTMTELVQRLLAELNVADQAPVKLLRVRPRGRSRSAAPAHAPPHSME